MWKRLINKHRNTSVSKSENNSQSNSTTNSTFRVENSNVTNEYSEVYMGETANSNSNENIDTSTVYDPILPVPEGKSTSVVTKSKDSVESLSKSQKALIKNWIRRKSNKFYMGNGHECQCSNNNNNNGSLPRSPIIPDFDSSSNTNSTTCPTCHGNLSSSSKNGHLKLSHTSSNASNKINFRGHNTKRKSTTGSIEPKPYGNGNSRSQDDHFLVLPSQNSFAFDNNSNSQNRPDRIDPNSEDCKSLENLLRNPKLRSIFRQFLESEFSDENLEFYEAIEKISEQHHNCQLNGEDLLCECQKIIDTFVVANSPREVNIDAITRNNLLSKMGSKEINVEVLTSAQAKIYNLMARDSFSRFLKSSHFL